MKLEKGCLAASAIFLTCLAYFLVASSIGWRHSILDGNQWRETQTALSAYYMVGRRPVLAYETPLLGPPWSMPYEFPVYQWTVAGLVTLLHTPLEQTGRAVNLTFFLLTLVPANYILSALGVRRGPRWLILALILLSPFYVFWSRTFTIESTALFFSASYAALAVVSYCRLRTGTVLAAIAFGCLAAMVKITTLPPFLLVAPLVSATARNRKDQSITGAARWAGVAVVLLPVLAGIGWTRFADGIKSENPIARTLTSQAIAEWNFGTLTQRLQLENWGTVFGWWGQVIGSPVVLAVAALAVLLLRRRRIEFLVCLALALSAPLVFFNLHVMHDYYTYANGVFLIVAVGFAVVAAFERGGGWAWLGGGLLLVVSAACLVRYERDFYPRLLTDSDALPEIRAVADSAQRLTRPDDVLLILGSEWSPSIPYYSHRRALMIPAEFLQDLVQKPADWVKRLSPRRVGALIICQRPNAFLDPRQLRPVFKAFNIDPRGQEVAGWYLLFPRRKSR